MPRYSQTFERVNFGTRPVQVEAVTIEFETDVPFEDDAFEDDAFEKALWNALWDQSGWRDRPWPEGFSSALTKGPCRKLP